MDRPVPERLRELCERVSYTYAGDDEHHRGRAVTVNVTICGRSFQQPYKYDLLMPNGEIRHNIPSTQIKNALPEQPLLVADFRKRFQSLP